MSHKQFAVLVIILALPLFSTPLILSAAPDADSPLVLFGWMYPFYLIASAWLAWKVYPRRQDLAWILVILMVMSTAAMWWLATHPDLLTL
ncbi:MAG: hypothetical protein K2K55_07175 [Duncaniella sp.]|nr:hypothetical protein [Duncaniella sp.]